MKIKYPNYNLLSFYHDLESLFAATLVIAGVYGINLTVKGKPLPAFFREETPFSEKIGKLTREEGGVRYKLSGSIVWQDVVENSTPVGYGDSAFTGSDGKAELTIGKQNSAEMLANSLVIVQKLAGQPGKPDQVVLNVKGGRISLSLNKGEDAPVIKMNDQLFKLGNQENAQIDIAVDPKKNSRHMSITSKDSGASVTPINQSGKPEKTRELKADKETNFDAQAPEAETPQTTAASDAAKKEGLPPEEISPSSNEERKETPSASTVDATQSSSKGSSKNTHRSSHGNVDWKEVAVMELKIILYVFLVVLAIAALVFAFRFLMPKSWSADQEITNAQKDFLRRIREEEANNRKNKKK